ncbi:MAG: F0F1 ATP synthase subunit epsilon [Oscillospiraceae bacterium]|nr:F0F1 ATP synthase subunit epsilon [Oscillospiraceae bacterium]
MNTFHLTVSSPDGNKFDGDVIKLDVRGVEGDLAIMAGHIAFITSIVEAPLTISLEDGTKRTAVSKGGLLTVSNNSAVLISGSFEFD